MASYAYVYCFFEHPIRDGETVCYKIGCATRPHHRRKSLVSGNARSIEPLFLIGPFGSLAEAERYEQEIHVTMKEFNARGNCEWFTVNPLERGRFYEWYATRRRKFSAMGARMIPKHDIARGLWRKHGHRWKTDVPAAAKSGR
jgi:hypothetical protein